VIVSGGGEKVCRQSPDTTSAGARSRPNALFLAAPLDRTKPAQRPARAKQMTGSHCQLRKRQSEVPGNMAFSMSSIYLRDSSQESDAVNRAPGRSGLER